MLHFDVRDSIFSLAHSQIMFQTVERCRGLVANCEQQSALHIYLQVTSFLSLMQNSLHHFTISSREIFLVTFHSLIRTIYRMNFSCTLESPFCQLMRKKIEPRSKISVRFSLRGNHVFKQFRLVTIATVFIKMDIVPL